MGYAAIGSGGIHATTTLSLSGQTTRTSFFQTLYNVYASKRAAESAPGVGIGTDLAVIQLDKVYRCTKPVLDKLKAIFEETNTKPAISFTDLEKIYATETTS